MAVTLTANYKEVFDIATVEYIDELLDDNYELTDILEFIDEHNEVTFVTFYAEYVEQGEKLGYDVVDAFVSENGFCDVASCEDAFVGVYASGADFAEEYANESGDSIPDWVIVDWDLTWERGLAYDYTFVEGDGYRTGYVFRRYF
jgi:antirestriction protein